MRAITAAMRSSLATPIRASAAASTRSMTSTPAFSATATAAAGVLPRQSASLRSHICTPLCAHSISTSAAAAAAAAASPIAPAARAATSTAASSSSSTSPSTSSTHVCTPQCSHSAAGLSTSAATAAAAAAAAAVAPSTQHDLSDIFKANKNWVAKCKEQDPAFFHKLGTTHRPKYMYIGCADARVAANEIMGLQPGEVFVLRNIANQVVNTDVAMLSCVDFAIGVLGVEHILVTGHYECGGIRAAMTETDMGLLDPWLRQIRDVYRLHQEELDAISNIDARYNRLIELNVAEQAINVFKNAVVQRKRKESLAGKGSALPQVHGLVFDPKDGVLKRIDVDFDKALRKFGHIYSTIKDWPRP